LTAFWGACGAALSRRMPQTPAAGRSSALRGYMRTLRTIDASNGRCSSPVSFCCPQAAVDSAMLLLTAFSPCTSRHGSLLNQSSHLKMAFPTARALLARREGRCCCPSLLYSSPRYVRKLNICMRVCDLIGPPNSNVSVFARVGGGSAGCARCKKKRRASGVQCSARSGSRRAVVSNSAVKDGIVVDEYDANTGAATLHQAHDALFDRSSWQLALLIDYPTASTFCSKLRVPGWVVVCTPGHAHHSLACERL